MRFFHLIISACWVLGFLSTNLAVAASTEYYCQGIWGKGQQVLMHLEVECPAIKSEHIAIPECGCGEVMPPFFSRQKLEVHCVYHAEDMATSKPVQSANSDWASSTAKILDCPAVPIARN